MSRSSVLSKSKFPRYKECLLILNFRARVEDLLSSRGKILLEDYSMR